MNSLIVPFTITAANLNLADQADQAIITFTSNDRLVRIPVRLELRKEAGTAYTLAPLGISDEIGAFRFKNSQRPDPLTGSYSDLFSGNQYLIVKDNLGQPFFKVPAVGFLDQATAQNRVAIADVSGYTLKSGASSFSLRVGVGISGGTGSLSGRLYLEEAAVPEA